MMVNAKIAVALVILLAVEVAWLARWDIISADSMPVAYQLDRWTGTIYFVQGMYGRQRIEDKQ